MPTAPPIPKICAFPCNRHCKKKGIEAGIIEPLAEVASGRDYDTFLGLGNCCEPRGDVAALLLALTIYLATLVCPISTPSMSNSPWIRGAPHSELAMLMSRISLRTSSGTVGRPRIRFETRAMPTNDCVRLDDRQRTASLGKQSIEAHKYQPIKNTEGLPSRSGAPQNVDLLPNTKSWQL
jgi:hypothetical protein